MNNRIAGYDLIRSFAILVVFLGHIVGRQATSKVLLLTSHSLSPGLTMSLLGFTSAVLLSLKEEDSGTFLTRRFTRIYIPLFVCLLFVLGAHALIGKMVINQHVLLHFFGLSAFFDLFVVQNKASIGGGLWFVTVIVIMYLVLPLLQKLFRHPRGMAHLLLIILACTALNFVMYGTASSWNVVISFMVGVYLVVNGRIDRLIHTGMNRSLLGSVAVLALAALATGGVLPYSVRWVLFALYPLVFVPLIFAVVKWLPTPVVAASSFFAALSYEFYILHFYFINEGFRDFFPIQVGLITQIGISFVTTFMLAYVLSRVAARLRKVVDRYLVVQVDGAKVGTTGARA